MRWGLVALAALAIVGGYAVSGVVGAESAQVAHGKYLVQLGGCTDCHTPGHLLGKPDMSKPDMSRFLGGSDVGLEFPGLGVFVAPNLMPDKVTGLERPVTSRSRQQPEAIVREKSDLPS